MTKLVVWLLFFGLFTIQTVGHMNSDPAPGRSPGPPTPAAPPTAAETVASSADDRSLNRDEDFENMRLTPGQDASEAIHQQLNHNNNNNEATSNTATISNIINNSSSEINFGLRKFRKIKTNDQKSDGNNKESSIALSHDVLANDSLLEGGRAAPSLRQSDKSQKHSADESVSCRKGLSGFSADLGAMDELTQGEDDTRNREQRPYLDIKLQLDHELFESTALGGIVCGLMYKVNLQTVLPPSSSLLVSPNSPSAYSPSSETSSSQHRISSEMYSNSYSSVEFYVETLSTSNGQERGSFVSQSLGNKLPISWFNSLHRNEADSPANRWDSRKTDATSEEAASSSAEDDFSAGDNAAESHAAQATVNNPPRGWNANAGISSGNGTTKECPDNKWHGDTRRSSVSGTTESKTLWMVNEFCEQDDEIEFRIYFRAASGNSNSNRSNANNGNQEGGGENQHAVLKKTFKFKLLKDCQLQLKEAAAGTLDYTSLPLYSTNCTVHFPSYTLSTNASSTSGSLTAGILVELQRLNVPCRSGSFLRFNERTDLCGKLEELSDNDRIYHFNVLDRTSVLIVRNPMFSLTYKLVDYCYNVSSSNQAGEYYIRSAIHDSLECFFRIHLPHGNRILLRLVANNDSDILQSSASGSNGDPETTIYTSLGKRIHTQLINLTLSDSNFVLQMQSPDRSNAATASNRTKTLETNPVDDSESETPTSNDAYNVFGFLSESNAHGKLFAGSAKATVNCGGIVIKVFENDFAKWSYCVNDALTQRAFILESTSNTLSIHLYRPTLSRNQFGFSSAHRMDGASNAQPPALSLPAVFLAYEARPVPAIVSNCDFGWIAMQQFCVSAVGMALSWSDAEQQCIDFGGHLASIRNDLQQQVIDEMLINSPGYQNHYAYWVGGSDKNFEADFRWSDGLPFQYTNWFPGWSQHGHYNKQPNDDGLSSQDCIELRRYFRTPPGVQTNRNPLARNFMWNDRDCNAKNFFICERAMSDDTLRRSWINDCNKTVSLTKEHPRASIWSPSFPRQYPDNANCFTTVTAPSGYRIVIEFEELVIESEPGCTYDYLEITEPTQADFSKIPKSSKHKNTKTNNNNYSATTDTTNKYTNKNLRKRSSYENPSLSSYTSTSTTNYNDNFKANLKNYKNNFYSNSYYNNYNVAQTNYQNLLNVFSTLYKPHTNFIIQTPDYPKGNPYYPTNHVRPEAELPKRLCGDWSTKLKLLRHVTSGSYLGLHFVSDYSHHFGGYKAKTYMENTASECSNERLKPYNGSCYLIVSYPEVDWWTAQQVCRSMGARLSSVSSPDEHRFVTSNIRNQIDYSPQLIYWLGAELERSGHFEWTDDTKMSFQGWLPGQGQLGVLPSDTTCLGLQWKMSPTPMLPSGLYWQSQKCNKVGGYVCKKPKESFGRFAFNNSTVTGTEGRLISPAYPNAYPLNIDYWIHIQAPERTRLVVQFQKIDLEPQDECLYDFVSIENYELISKITLEPGTNPVPMAMLMSDELSEDDESSLLGSDFLPNNKIHNRIGRSIAKTRRKMATGDQSHTEKQSHLTTSSARRIDFNGDKYFATDDKRFRFTQMRKTTKWKWPEHITPAHGSALKSNENPKRRRRKSFAKEIGKNKRKPHEGRVHRTQPFSLSTAENYNSLQYRRMHKRNRRSTVVGGGSFGDDAMFAPLADNAQSFLPYVRWCGSHDSNMSKFDFVSTSNQVVLNFHSDFSITGLGFAAIWKAIDVSGCPVQTLTSRQGTIFSPNFPHFLLNSLSCAYIIQAPVGRRVWLEFIEFDMLSDAALEVDIGNGVFRPFRMRQHVNDGIFVSVREQLRVQFRTGQHPRGKGFQAAYHTVGQLERRERVINLSENITGYLFHLNYPHDMLENVDFTQNLVAPFGSNILLELQGVEFTENGCPDNNILEIYDNYADNNGTRWKLCKFQNSLLHTGSADDDDNVPSRTELDPYSYQQSLYGYMNPASGHLARLSTGRGNPQRQQYAAPPVYITSYLNTLHIRQRTTSKSDFSLNATVRIQIDNNYKLKLATADKSVETCQPNPCQFKGKCVTNNGIHYCQCQGQYTGRFCGLNLCELEPCVFGKCELTTTGFKCICQPGYMGITCEQKQRPCSDNPCEGRGICYEKNGGFFCRCHAWWEGHRCERRMLHIPYKPLSERMLQEPFWLGLITVFVVLAVIGLVWCAKRHFPEKIEKLLAEEADRNRPPGSIHGHHHHTSLREQLQFTTAIPQTTTNTVPGAPRSILNRLGIRKPSLLSLSSPNPIAGGGGAAARTFSLDDLLRPPPRRSPSPRKKRNNSTPVKKNAAEKKQILQQLVSPAAATPSPKVSLGDLISMSENRVRVAAADSESDIKETTFSENSGSLASCSAARSVIDSKFEKKVTFARLLNKVSAEMTSGSEVNIGQKGGKRNSSALSLPTDIQFRASSVPPSPCANDIRSPHSTSSNQGSDSLSSSDVALADFGMRSLHTNNSENSLNHNNIGIAGGLQRCRFGSTTRPKVSSADSILAMFRSFASTAASNNQTSSIPSNASIFASPSTTPMASSPQDDAPGDDESSTSSIHTPVSFTSGPPDSPLFYRHTTIEVPVLDVLNAHKSTPQSSSTSLSATNHLHPPTILLEIPSCGMNSKCLSPIREMPTPIPSPALTPIMPRPQRSNSPIFQEYPLSTGDCSDDDDDKSDCSDAQLSDHILLGLKLDKYRSVDTPTDTATTSTADMNRHKAVGKVPAMVLNPAPAPPKTTLTPPCITIDVEPPTPDENTRRPRNLIIPTLTVEQPSPTKHRYPMIIFPGSPPPQRASIGETSFMFPNKQQQKRLLKQFEKPTSLDFPFAPPTITVTSNMSEMESDAESLSPVPKVGAASGLMPPNPVGMCYLSPFTMCSRADRTISESNLSSSGYSSMASPGPSRCGSSNPLCPNEMDEPGSGHSAAGLPLHVNLLNRRRSSALANCKENITNGKGSQASGNSGSSTDRIRQRSDSETFSDDILIESNDEGIGTDHVDEKLEDSRLSDNRFKELHLFMEDQILIEVDESLHLPPLAVTTSSQMDQLQLPQIVIQIDGNEKGLSPVSSRSESPLSERAGITRFSPHFYGRKDQLPFTDSDGLYDFPSSDGKGVSSHTYTHQRRSSSKKRDRKSSKCSNVTQSPTKHQLDVPSKSDSMNTSTSTGSAHVCNKHCHSHHHHCSASTATTRKSPKRRPVNRHPVATSSSSSESLVSAKELAVRSLPRRFNSPNREKRPRKQESLSEDEVADALLRRISPSIVREEIESSKPKCKINRLRAIGNQIRFLRRLQKSIKTRERLASPSDSCPEENTDDLDSPQATSPLLQLSSPSKSRLALCRQKRIPSGTYGIKTAALNASWRGMDRSLIAGEDDLNSD